MSDYRIILTGELDDGVELEAAKAAFCSRFKIDQDKAARFFTGKPVVLKKSADKQMAVRYKKILDGIGVGCRVEALDGAGAGNATTAAAKESAQTAKAPGDRAEEPAAAAKAPAGGNGEPAAPTKTPAAEAAPAPVTESDPDTPGYAYRIEGRPDYAFLTVEVPADATLKVEASAMATMDTHMVMKTKMRGGLGRLLTSESIFINEFTAQGGRGVIGIAPGAPGDIGHVYLDGDIIYLQNSAFVASDMGIEVETKWQGLTKGFFSGESLFLIRCKGKGDLWFNTYGAMIELDVDGDYVVDTGNIVAFTDGLEYKVSKVGGYKSLFLSGEGFVCRFSGKGKVWIQTRGVQPFAFWLRPFRPVKRSSS